jgi:hypothetical protein
VFLVLSFVFFVVNSSSKLESCHDLPISRTESIRRIIVIIDETITVRQPAEFVPVYQSAGIVGRRSRQVEAIKDVEKLSPDLKGHPLFDRETAAEAEALRHLTLPAEVVIVTGGISELPQRRVHPGSGVQDEFLARIDAPAIGVLQE